MNKHRGRVGRAFEETVRRSSLDPEIDLARDRYGELLDPVARRCWYYFNQGWKLRGASHNEPEPPIP